MNSTSINPNSTQKIRFVAAVYTVFGLIGLLFFSVPGLLLVFLLVASAGGIYGTEPLPADGMIAVSIGLAFHFALTYASYRAIRVASALRRGEPSIAREAKSIAVLLLPIGLLIGAICYSRINRYYNDHIQLLANEKNNQLLNDAVKMAA